MRYLLTLLLLSVGLQAAPWNPATVDGFTPSLLRGLVAYWTLDEASGERKDSWSTNNFTDVNAGGNSVGKIGLSWTNTSTSRLEASSNAFNLAVFSVSLWANLRLTGGDFVMCQDGISSGTRKWAFYQTGGNLQLYAFTNAASAYAVSANVKAYTNTWQHYVLMFTQTNVTIYTNGVLNQTFNINSQTYNVAKPLSIGEATAGNPVDGAVDEVGFWARTLSASESANLYNATKARRFPFNSGP